MFRGVKLIIRFKYIVDRPQFTANFLMLTGHYIFDKYLYLQSINVQYGSTKKIEHQLSGIYGGTP